MCDGGRTEAHICSDQKTSAIKLCAEIYPNFEVPVPSLVQLVTACRKILIITRWSIDFLIPGPFQGYHSTDHPYSRTPSSSPPCILHTTLHLRNVRGEQSIRWGVMCNPSNPFCLSIYSTTTLKMEFHKLRSRLLLQSIFPRKRKRHKLFQIVLGRQVKWVWLISGASCPQWCSHVICKAC